MWKRLTDQSIDVGTHEVAYIHKGKVAVTTAYLCDNGCWVYKDENGLHNKISPIAIYEEPDISCSFAIVDMQDLSNRLQNVIENTLRQEKRGRTYEYSTCGYRSFVETLKKRLRTYLRELEQE